MSNVFKRPAPAHNSFLPQDYINERTDARANILTLTLFAVTMAGVVGAFFVTNRHWQSLRNRQQVINADYEAEGKKIDQLKELENQRAGIMEKAEITAALVEKLPRWAVLGELTLRMPSTMRLDQFVLKSTRINQTPGPIVAPAAAASAKAQPQSLIKNLTDKAKDGKDKKPARPRIEPPKFEYAVTIEGTADLNNDIADFLASLKRSPVFEKVELPFIRDAKELGRDLRKFQITAALRQNIGTGELSSSLQDLVNVRTAELKLAKESTDKANAQQGVSQDSKSQGLITGTVTNGGNQ